MRITYLQHSGFVLEDEQVVFIFDYVEGELPLFSPQQYIYVFISHEHADHYQPQVFDLAGRYPLIAFFYPEGVKPPRETDQNYLVSSRQHIRIQKARKALEIQTLASTDLGVAWLIRYDQEMIYHAGDLHWWKWSGESEGFNDRMEDDFKKEVAVLAGVTIDYAFLPLDGRLEENYSLGFDYIMRLANIRHAFPMHLWKNYGLITQFKQLACTAGYRERIVEINQPGQVFEC